MGSGINIQLDISQGNGVYKRIKNNGIIKQLNLTCLKVNCNV